MSNGSIKILLSGKSALFFLIAINVAVAVVIGISSLFSGNIEESVIAALVLPERWSSFIGKPWSLLTYMFTQLSFLHLLFNMLWLYWFGRIFIYCASQKQLVLTYLLGGLTGALFFLAVCNIGSPSGGVFLTGASAAVLAVMTAASVMAPNLELNMLLLGQIRLKYVALLCIVLTFIGIGGGNAGGFSAHFGGVLFGLFAPSILSRRKSIRITTPDFIRRIIHKFRSRKRQIPEAFRNPGPINSTPGISDEERLDQLLDKVRVSGYDSLSPAEKTELNAISSRL